MKWSARELREKIKAAIPEGTITPEHDETGHHYRIQPQNVRYDSVTDAISVIKDESIINWKMKKALEYVFERWNEFTPGNVMEHLSLAERAPADIFQDAGDIGTDIHEYREKYFTTWIVNGARPASALEFLPPDRDDLRANSALRALEAFVKDHLYEPVVSEQLVYSHKLRRGGTLDDLGLMRKVIRRGNPSCMHDFFERPNGAFVCMQCDYKYRNQFVLMDIKTSNAFKDHYFFQVALYYWMFRELVGIAPERCFVLKLSKEDGTYKIEDLKQPATLAGYARSMLRTREGLEFIKSLRKDNQKVVLNLKTS